MNSLTGEGFSETGSWLSSTRYLRVNESHGDDEYSEATENDARARPDGVTNLRHPSVQLTMVEQEKCAGNMIVTSSTSGADARTVDWSRYHSGPLNMHGQHR